MRCRYCNSTDLHEVVDLGHTPLANAFLTADQLRSAAETSFPLRVVFCRKCYLVQLTYVVPPSLLFRDYAYFSSAVPAWLRNAEERAGALTERFRLGPDDLVVEVGSNDGYLLRHFVPRGTPVLGIDPARACAEEAERHGVPTHVAFFDPDVARNLVDQGFRARVLTGTNVFAHVPDVRRFLKACSLLLRKDGVVTFEFPHLLATIEGRQFDCLYHEHYQTYSLLFLRRAFEEFGMHIFDVERLPTHGGSLRIYAAFEDGPHDVTPAVDETVRMEQAAELDYDSGYNGFTAAVDRLRFDLLAYLVDCRRMGKRVAIYGAPAKGSTLLNASGVTRDLVAFAVDDSPHKQGRYIPGCHIPIVPRAWLAEHQPDVVLITAWNYAKEIMEANPEVKGRWVVPIPEITVL